MTAVVSTNNKSEVATADQVKAHVVTPAISTLVELNGPAKGPGIVQEIQLKISNHTSANDQKQMGSEAVPIEEQIDTLNKKAQSLLDAILAQNVAPTAATTKDVVAGAAIEKKEKEEKEEAQSRVVIAIDALADFLEAFSKGKVDHNKDKDDRKIKKTPKAA